MGQDKTSKSSEKENRKRKKKAIYFPYLLMSPSMPLSMTLVVLLSTTNESLHYNIACPQKRNPVKNVENFHLTNSPDGNSFSQLRATASSNALTKMVLAASSVPSGLYPPDLSAMIGEC